MSHHGGAEGTEVKIPSSTSVLSVSPWCTLPFRFELELSLLSIAIWNYVSHFSIADRSICRAR